MNDKIEFIDASYQKLIKPTIYNLIFNRLAKKYRPGLLGWMARLVKHPYGWTENISAEDNKALTDLAELWNLKSDSKTWQVKDETITGETRLYIE